MILQGKDYVAPDAAVNTISKAKKDAIKARIKELCPKDAKESYEVLIRTIQDEYRASEEYFTNDELKTIIDEVKTEADYTLVVPEEPLEL